MSERIDWLDGWRTFAICLMVPWHFLWDLCTVGRLPASFVWGDGMQLVRYVIVYSFVLLSGVSARYSRSNVRRGLRLWGWALVITAVTTLVGDPAKFGILHLLGSCCLLWAAGERLFTRVPARWGLLGAYALFVPLEIWLRRFRVTVGWLWPLGFRTASFYSSDYYPIIPWALLFLTGTYLGALIRESDGAWKRRRLPPALTWPGRHALWIYLLHQPLLYGLAQLLK